jgi:hypothetical protein
MVIPDLLGSASVLRSIGRVRYDLIDRFSLSHEPETLSCELLDANGVGLNPANLHPEVRIDPFQLLDLLLQLAGVLQHAHVFPHAHVVKEEGERQHDGKDAADQKRGAFGSLPNALQGLLASISPGHEREEDVIGVRLDPDRRAGL